MHRRRKVIVLMRIYFQKPFNLFHQPQAAQDLDTS
jgi:hypothetical protein